jgi:hypothetical protein
VAKTIAFFNQAGGVAKTSLTILMGLESHELDSIIADWLLDEDAPLPIHRGQGWHGLSPSQP